MVSSMKMPELKIGHLVSRLPIIQGGMGVRVSGPKLASAVSREGALGVIVELQGPALPAQTGDPRRRAKTG